MEPPSPCTQTRGRPATALCAATWRQRAAAAGALPHPARTCCRSMSATCCSGAAWSRWVGVWQIGCGCGRCVPCFGCRMQQCSPAQACNRTTSTWTCLLCPYASHAAPSTTGRKSCGMLSQGRSVGAAAAQLGERGAGAAGRPAGAGQCERLFGQPQAHGGVLLLHFLH